MTLALPGATVFIAFAQHAAMTVRPVGGTRYGMTKTVFVPGHWHCLACPVAGWLTGRFWSQSRCPSNDPQTPSPHQPTGTQTHPPQ